MKYFGVDWGGVAAALPAWVALPVAARAAVLAKMRNTTAGAPAAELGPAAAAVRASGFVDVSKTGKRFVPRPANRPLLTLVRALDRQRIWDVPTAASLAEYLLEHFTSDELLRFQNPGSHVVTYVDRRALAELATSEEWVEAFLAADTAQKALEWERERLPRGELPRFARPGVWEATRHVVRALLALPGPVPLRELPARFPGLNGPRLWEALEAGLRFLLVFAGVREGELEPVVGAWPGLGARLRADPPPLPAPVPAAEAFEAAWLMEDMTTVLVATAAEPVRLRVNDGEMFARAREQIAARLVSLPAWAEAKLDLPREARVDYAANILSVFRFVRVAEPQGRPELRLEPTKEGAAWLELSDHDRLAALLAPVRGHAERNPPYGYAVSPGFHFFPVAASGHVRDKTLDLRADVERLFLSLPDGFVSLNEFLEHARRADNPLLERVRRGTRPMDLYWGGRQPVRRDWERLWGDMLEAMLLRRLAPLGGARLGRTEGGALCFSLTGAGRYLLGGADQFEYGHEVAAGVIVQPNFEIVFLAPAPRVEARLGRFAERVGTGAGVMFRLTRASVMAAAEAGMDGEKMVEALRSASSRELPANVARQLRDWLGGVRRVRVRPATLLECPDAETAGRVRAAAGPGARALTDTVLELPGATGKEHAALVKKLRTAGIFVA